MSKKSIVAKEFPKMSIYYSKIALLAPKPPERAATAEESFVPDPSPSTHAPRKRYPRSWGTPHFDTGIKLYRKYQK